MICQHCGADISDNALFCTHCGTRVERGPDLEPAAAAAVPEEPAATPVAVSEEPAAAPVATEAPVPQSAPVTAKKPAWQPYGAPVKEEPLFDFEKTTLPKYQLPTRRGLLKMIFLGLITFGIYPMVIWSRLASEVNMVASRYDGERSMSYLGAVMLAPITLGIHSLVWIHKLCRRIGAEIRRREIKYNFGAKDFWIWDVLLPFLFACCVCVCAFLVIAEFSYGLPSGVAVLFRNPATRVPMWIMLISGILTYVGPFIYIHKLLRAMNLMNEHYNNNG